MRETDRSHQLSKHSSAKAVVSCLLIFCLNSATVAQVVEDSLRQSEDFQILDEDGNVIDSKHFENERHEGFVGCLLSDAVCNEDELCFDDLVFGRCISSQDNGNNDVLYRYESLSPEDRLLLELEMDRLSNMGYNWSDDYAQCVFQTILNTIRYHLDVDTSLCDVLREDPQIEHALIDPSQVTPESMIPPNLSGEDLGVQPSSLEDQDFPVENSLSYSPEADFALQPLVKRSEKEQAPGWIYGEFDDVNEDEAVSSDEDFMSPEEKIQMANYLNMREALNGQSPYAPLAEAVLSEVPENEAVYFPIEDYEDYEDDEDIPYKRKREEEEEEMIRNDDDGSPFIYRERARDPDYEEEDLLVAPSLDYPSYDDQPTYDDIDYPMEEVGSSLANKIFNRNERLDVKKPGPFFPNSANNFFLNKLLVGNGIESEEANDTAKKDQGQVEYEMPLLAPVKDKRDLPIDYIDVPVPQSSYVHIGLKNRLDTLRQGEALIEAIANSVGIPNHAFSDRKIETNHVQFQVDSNPQDMDAHTIAKKLDEDYELQKRLTDSIGVEIEKAAAGERDDPNGPSLVLPTGSGLNLLILIVTLVSTAAALLVVGLILLLVRRKARNNKLLRQDEGEQEKGKAQSEYKQLCRDWSRSSKPVDRQTSKGSTSSPSNPATKQLQSRDSKDSDRSSTSSWTEEPSSTNMDISTGHMVLAYMEDHLKNKQRLEQEWVGLCGYEAEPCATTVAFKTENKKKNRYPDQLPYDHNRVILNALLNATNSDYINASTVTDHDPRNPSYIVTQGPLAQTVADFWQMVWEQGCVVIVMLTRLQDNGNQLCHRYWPEEGSEQYHIFEVHLVSEHVWCDDYLVRSVYLKNTRTGETRTVTQFHFRSWPAAGTPTSTKALLEFRRKVNKSYRGRSCPIVVHCSDGVGRSGTYVLIDMVLNRMAKGCKEIDIAATLEHIRDQRGGMVQNRQQFEFCLMAVAEEVHAILKAMPQ